MNSLFARSAIYKLVTGIIFADSVLSLILHMTSIYLIIFIRIK